MDAIERQAPGFFFAGHYRDGISLGDSIVSGGNSVERIERFLGSRRSADLQSAVSQVSNLRASTTGIEASRLQIGDTAGCKAALPHEPPA
jgi:hypothetical protein